jgi:peptidoglycan/xylan/chitin deacetylase (PgdA/CDA1 family)
LLSGEPIKSEHIGKTKIIVFHHLINNKKFAKIVNHIHSKYNVISFDDYLIGRVSPININIIISIDDGYKSVIKGGLDIFKKLKIKPLIFINSDFISLNRAEATKYCHKKMYTIAEEAMSWNDINELISAGCEIGSHGLKHYNLSNIEDYSELEYLIKTDTRIIRENTNFDTRSFAYPFGLYNQNAIQVVERCSIKYGFTSDPGFLEDSKSNLALKRSNIGIRSLSVVDSIINGYSDQITYYVSKIRNLACKEM